ncbi:UNVERIFIED_CONTAM: hypothetical protein Sradi_5741900 [Sesamum radiatum]|uniref:Retroviral polymerase SH3-like domain-containing protein n=1 Tax=Sesamum radiatum TaxID=300843 RepID=A0AAW2L2D5_SESRA
MPQLVSRGPLSRPSLLPLGEGPSCRPPLNSSRTPNLVVLDEDDGNLALEVIKTIRNLPDCLVNSLDVSFESTSSSPIVVVKKASESISDEVREECSSVPRVQCFVMDVDSCDSALSYEEFSFLEGNYNSSPPIGFLLPSPRDRIKHPPWISSRSIPYISLRVFTLPPLPLLVEIVKSVGLSISQFTPNACTFFLGFLHRFSELDLDPSFEAFHTPFFIKKVMNDSFFYFYPSNNCKKISLEVVRRFKASRENPSENTSRSQLPLPPPHGKASSERRESSPQRARDTSSGRRSPPLASGGSRSKPPRDASSDQFLMAWGKVTLPMRLISVRASLHIWIPQIVPNKRNKVTPYELWYKKKPNLNYLRIWGCRAVVRLPEPKKKSLGERGIDCIFIGYAEHSKAYRFYVIAPNDFISVSTVIESRDAIFDQTRFPSIPRPQERIPSTSGTSKETESFKVTPDESMKLRKSRE